MIHCMQCGAKLEEKYLASEGKNIPWCPVCSAYRFPVFNAGVSMIITNPKRDKVLLIRQYGGDEYILCAGYINRGEDAEDAAIDGRDYKLTGEARIEGHYPFYLQ